MQLFNLCCDVNSLLAPEPSRRFPTKTDSRYILTYNGNCTVHIIAVTNDSRWLSCNCHPTPKVRARRKADLKRHPSASGMMMVHADVGLSSYILISQWHACK